MARTRFFLLFVFVVTCFGAGLGAQAAAAPDFEFIKTWHLEADKYYLSDFRGRPVLLETWASWCPHCPPVVHEMNRIHAKFGGQGLQVISVSDEETATIARYIENQGVEYGIARAFGVGKLYGHTGVPHIWLINAAGNITWHGHPSELTDRQIQTTIGVTARAGAPDGGEGQQSDGASWWIWLIIAPAVLFVGAMGWFLWSSRDRAANYQTAMYSQPPAQRPPPPAYGAPQPPPPYGAPQPIPQHPGQPASYPMQEPFQQGGYHGSPSSVPLTRVIAKPNAYGQDGSYETPGGAAKAEPPPLEQRPYLGQNPAHGGPPIPPYDTNRNRPGSR